DRGQRATILPRGQSALGGAVPGDFPRHRWHDDNGRAHRPRLECRSRLTRQIDMSDVVKKLKRGRRWSCGEALVLVAILIVAVCLLLPAVQVVVWVGSRDVDFTVLVLDAETQSPIAN